MWLQKRIDTSSTLTMLFFCVAALVYTIGCKVGGVLVNPVAKFLGGISFEIYLCHMVIYRVLEKLHLVHLFGNGLLAYIFTAVAVICGSVVFSVCTSLIHRWDTKTSFTTHFFGKIQYIGIK